MSEAEAVAVTETADIEDSQVDKFFESGGEIEQVAEPETTAEEKQEDKPEKTVPYGALHEERMRRKELQQQVERNEQRTQQMEEAFRKLVERAQQPQEPSFDEDPLNALRHQNEQLQQRLAHYDQRFQQSDQQQQAYLQQQKFVSDYQQQAAEFAKATPEFTDAYRHLVDTRQRELVSVGYSQQEAAQMLVQEEAMIVGKAMQDGVNPAERVFELAKMRGWRAAEKAANNAVEQRPATNQGAEKLEAIAKGQKAAATLSGGGTARADLSLEALAGLSDDDFDKAWEKLIGPSA